MHIRAQSVDGPRNIISLNESWEFTKDNYDPAAGTVSPNVKWESVQLPHTWNANDVMDDEPGYYRGVGWYRKKISIHSSGKNKQLYLRFEGVNQVATVFVNGKKAGSHTGGYTAFQFPISSFLRYDGKQNSNEILVKVDNSFNEQIPPLTADFTFFGGAYRDVWLMTVSPVHFSLSDHGSNGIYISTPQVTAEKASVHIRGKLINPERSARQVSVRTILLDKDGKQLKVVQTAVLLKPLAETNFIQSITSINDPHLWSPDDPYLYKVKTIVSEKASGKLLDEVVNPLGFRWFRFDAAKGFFLNGKPLKLVGVS
ncbi:MAG: sugar-binding domain-containing protein, partial [Chitinophagaceae bacterium]